MEAFEEKLKWLKSIGLQEFKKPMKYYLGTNHTFSEEYIRNTPLSVLKEKYDESLVDRD